MDAPACGSHAHRAAIFWQNLLPTDVLSQAYHRLPSGPTTSINQLLALHNIEGWRTQELIQGRNWHPDDRINKAGRDQRVLPKFVCFVGSHKFRKTGNRPGLGMMHYLDQPLQEPTPEIREVAMGFGLHSTAAPGLNPAQRHHLLGQCIDRNLLTWIFSTAMDHTHPHSLGPAAPCAPPAYTPHPVREREREREVPLQRSRSCRLNCQRRLCALCNVYFYPRTSRRGSQTRRGAWISLHCSPFHPYFWGVAGGKLSELRDMLTNLAAFRHWQG